MTTPVVVVVGLGPAGPELITPQTLDLIEATAPRLLRTMRHPAAVTVEGALSCDDLYDTRSSFAEVYAAIADRVVDLAYQHGSVLYAVPGSPRVLERSVERLLSDDRIVVQLTPAMSFLDLTWARLGVDPIEAGVRLVDGHTFAISAAGERGPLLVAHCHNRRVLSDIKLSVDDPGDTPVMVMQRLGLPDERIAEVSWAELDREVDADHLTSLYIPQLASPVAAELMRFQDLVQTLRAECPWDREQTHVSLRRHLIEEAYEVLDAIDGFDPATGDGADHLEEELGDLLFQVFLHAVMGAEEGWFDLADVARTVHDKLHRRHPHVFGDVEVAGTDELVVSWEAQKLSEKGRESVLDGVASALPALSFAEKTLKKSGAIGAPLVSERVAALAGAVSAAAESPDDTTIGRALFALVASAREAGVDPEMALRAEIARTGDQVRRYETLKVDQPDASPAQLWSAASLASDL